MTYLIDHPILILAGWILISILVGFAFCGLIAFFRDLDYYEQLDADLDLFERARESPSFVEWAHEELDFNFPTPTDRSSSWTHKDELDLGRILRGEYVPPEHVVSQEWPK